MPVTVVTQAHWQAASASLRVTGRLPPLARRRAAGVSEARPAARGRTQAASGTTSKSA